MLEEIFWKDGAYRTKEGKLDVTPVSRPIMLRLRESTFASEKLRADVIQNALSNIILHRTGSGRESPVEKADAYCMNAPMSDGFGYHVYCGFQLYIKDSHTD